MSATASVTWGKAVGTQCHNAAESGQYNHSRCTQVNVHYYGTHVVGGPINRVGAVMGWSAGSKYAIVVYM